jgi:hypothetical protein
MIIAYKSMRKWTERSGFRCLRVRTDSPRLGRRGPSWDPDRLFRARDPIAWDLLPRAGRCRTRRPRDVRCSRGARSEVSRGSELLPGSRRNRTRSTRPDPAG